MAPAVGSIRRSEVRSRSSKEADVESTELDPKVLIERGNVLYHAEWKELFRAFSSFVYQFALLKNCP